MRRTEDHYQQILKSRVDAHERAMKNKWKEIEEKLWDRWKVEISTAQLADDLDKYIASIEKLKITKNKSDLDALKEQSADLRAMKCWFVNTREAKRNDKC